MTREQMILALTKYELQWLLDNPEHFNDVAKFFADGGFNNLTDAELQDNLMQNHALIQDLFGVDARPFYRPPFGVRDARTDAAAAAIGYTVPVMWYGSLSDSGYIEPSLLLEFANKWFLPEHIVIGHANQLPVTEVFPQLVDLLNERSLVTVTLNDVYEV